MAISKLSERPAALIHAVAHAGPLSFHDVLWVRLAIFGVVCAAAVDGFELQCGK